MSEKKRANTQDTYVGNTELLNDIFEKLETSDGADIDVEAIERELDLLQEKAPVKLPDNLQEKSLKELLEKHPELDKERKGRGKKIIKIRKAFYAIVAAAAMVVAFGIFAGASGFEPVVRLIDDVAQVFSDPSGELEINEISEGEYRSLREALDENGMEDALCITWIPKKFSASIIKLKQSSAFTRISAHYVSESDAITVVIKQYNDNNYSESVEKEEKTDEELVLHNEVEYHVSNNVDEINVWAEKNGYYYNIHGNISIEEMNRLLIGIK